MPSDRIDSTACAIAVEAAVTLDGLTYPRAGDQTGKQLAERALPPTEVDLKRGLPVQASP